VRQLRDKQELFVGGSAVIQLGKHRFNLNTQPLELAVVNRDGTPHLHLTSTKFSRPSRTRPFSRRAMCGIRKSFLKIATVYRAEYLAADVEISARRRRVRLRGETAAPSPPAAPKRSVLLSCRNSRPRATTKATPRACTISTARRFSTRSRHPSSCCNSRATIHRARLRRGFWHRFCPAEVRTLWTAKLNGFAERNRLFPGDAVQHDYIAALRTLDRAFVAETKLYPATVADAAGEYLFHELSTGDAFVVSREATETGGRSFRHLVQQRQRESFRPHAAGAVEHPGSELDLVRDWVRVSCARLRALRRMSSRGALPVPISTKSPLVFCGGDFSRASCRRRPRRRSRA
jgi:hypothetical protein